MWDLIESGDLKVDGIKHFILDECDKMLEGLGALILVKQQESACYLHMSVDMRKMVQQIFVRTPTEKQVMMFSATLPKDIKPVRTVAINMPCLMIVLAGLSQVHV